MEFTSRPYTDPADRQTVLDFVRTVRPPERVFDYPSLNDLEEQLPQPEVQANSRLWFAGDKLVAFALVDPWDNLWFDLQPAQQAALGDEIVQFGVDCLRARLAAGEAGNLETNCAENYSARRAFLEAHGFLALPEQTLGFARPLSEPIPDPVLPPGYSLRLLKGRDEAAAAAALHCAAFGSDYMTTENRLAMMETSEYYPEMDLVIVAPNGELAAYAMGFISIEENEKTGRKDGYVDPIATHPNHQRLGLARALLLTGMQMLKARGMETAKFGTSSQNAGMQKTAAAAGFQIENRKLWFRKVIE
jgi:ribosomal protein S18 acetylase RimI-like enzyme